MARPRAKKLPTAVVTPTGSAAPSPADKTILVPHRIPVDSDVQCATTDAGDSPDDDLVQAGQLPCEDVPLTRWDRKRRALRREENTDAMELFQQELPSATPVRDVVRYWASKSSDPRWEDLSRMALEYLSIPAMSAEHERVYSGGKITLSHRRCSMGTMPWKLLNA